MKDYMKIYEEWLSNPYFDEETKAELRAIKDDEKEIKERFYTDLEFGTAGLRGIIGAGINRMNIYVVRRATQGLANYIIKQGGAEKGVAIAYDSRRMSPEFAQEAALTLAANGIKAYKFESLRPTPELSFAVRELGCIAGINITASHNPPDYNGYKVYWEDGAQFTPPHDKGVTAEVLAIEDLSTVKTTDEASAKAAGKYQVLGSEIDDKYIDFFMRLKPVSYRLKGGKRTHVGFISQDVEEAMKAVGLTDLDFAGFCRDAKTQRVAKKRKVKVINEAGEEVTENVIYYEDAVVPNEYIYSLRYDEFIALNTAVIQRIYKRLSAPEGGRA